MRVETDRVRKSRDLYHGKGEKKKKKKKLREFSSFIYNFVAILWTSVHKVSGKI